MKKHHPFSHSVIEHHNDGSHTVHHIHEKHGHVHSVPVRDGDVKAAAGDHDGMIDHMMDHTSQPNHGEEVPAPVAGAGAVPAQGA